MTRLWQGKEAGLPPEGSSQADALFREQPARAERERGPFPEMLPPLRAESFAGPRTGLFRRLLRRIGGRDAPFDGRSLSWRYLARQIDVDLPVTSTGRAILFSSPAPMAVSNEATLMFAWFLAAELGKRVLIADGTFGEDGVGAVLGHAGALGFADLAYDSSFRLGDLVAGTTRANVFLLPAGRASGTDRPPIEPGRIAAFFDQARTGFDYVLLQQGPIYAETRYLLFTRPADMVLMLVEEGGTPVERLNRCLATFRDHQVSNVRLVLSVPK